MEIEDAVVEGLRVLPPDKQLEVLDFVAFLLRCGGAGAPRQYLEGEWPDLGAGITEADIAQAQREMEDDVALLEPPRKQGSDDE